MAIENCDENYPRLSYRHQIFLVARDRAKKKVLLGGLGAMGVGQMWVDENPDKYPAFENWDTAPEREAP